MAEQPVRGASRHESVEWSFTSRKPHADPFNGVELDALFSGAGGSWRVPAFWAGGDQWRVRFAAPSAGTYRFRTICTDTSDTGLHGQEGKLDAAAAASNMLFLKHGPVQVASSQRHLEHADGTPFFWLGDTWWMSLCRRLHWPAEFGQLTSDRVAKGFSVIQIVMGLYPDMPPFDERGANEQGFPWEAEYARIRPAYFDAADERLSHLVQSGLLPCIVGAWGYFMPWMGANKLKQHWRYLIARYASWPVVWCIAGEANLPYYLTKGFPFDDREQVHEWTKVAAYVKQVDPFHRPLSIHPTGLGRLTARGAVDDETLLDFDMLQTGHGDMDSLAPTVDTVRATYAAAPTMPVLNSEVNYEGIMGKCDASVQRLMFWSCVLSGACGHTYGANGLWQMNRKEQPHGNSPHGGNYGTTPWDDAMRLPGSTQLGLGKAFLQRYHWWELEPHQEWAAASGETAHPYGLHSAGVPRKLRMVYATKPVWKAGVRIEALDSSARFRALAFDPATGEELDIGQVTADKSGSWPVPLPGQPRDWVVVLQA